jgi:hypothetical protein
MSTLTRACILIWVFIILLSTAGCIPIVPKTPVAVTPVNIQPVVSTYVAQTVAVYQSQIAPTEAGVPILSETAFITDTPTPIITPTPLILTSTPTATATPCDQVRFINDITVPNGTVLEPDTQFTKVWRVQNTGACTWGDDYAIVYVSGSRMNADYVVSLPEEVVPEQIVDIPVNMIAPTKKGTYTGYWQLRNASGVLFGLGKDAAESFSVTIKVATIQSITSPYNFATEICKAVWSSGGGVLPCPGKLNDSRGYAYMSESPALENDSVDDEPTIIMHPQSVAEGFIRGIYPPFAVREGDVFAATIGCLRRKEHCNVQLKLEYQDINGVVNELGTWDEVYDGQINTIRISLSDLAGQEVQFILTALAKKSPADDVIFWMMPRIIE